MQATRFGSAHIPIRLSLRSSGWMVLKAPERSKNVILKAPLPLSRCLCASKTGDKLALTQIGVSH